MSTGKVINIKKLDPSTNAVNITAAIGELIDGVNTVCINKQWQTLGIQLSVLKD